MKFWFILFFIPFIQCCLLPEEGLQIVGLNGTFYPVSSPERCNQSRECFEIMARIWQDWENISFIELIPECNKSSSIDVSLEKINLPPPFEFGLMYFGVKNQDGFHPIGDLKVCYSVDKCFLHLSLEYFQPYVDSFGVYPV